MKPEDVRDLLFLPVTLERVQKAKALAIRQRMEWDLVLATLTDEQKKQVQDAQVP